MNANSRRWLLIGVGLVVANVIGVAFCFAFTALLRFSGQQANTPPVVRSLVAIGLWPSLVLVPMAMGFAAAYFWRSLAFRFWEYLVWWLVTALITPLGAYLILSEGTVCLLIGFPVLFVCGFAGVMLGWVILRSKTSTLNLSVIPLLLLVTLLEGEVRRDRRSAMEDQLHIEAPVETVWRYVVAFPRIDAASAYWLNKVGLPSPLETTCEGPFVGARRECIFTDGLVFREAVSEIIPRRLLTFEIVEQPSNPELLGHLTLHRGQFELREESDGSTTLVGRSWYTLHMRPLWYFDWWTRDITSHVHLRVMRHIKQLSESSR